MRSTINSPGRSACPLLSRERWRCSQISASLVYGGGSGSNNSIAIINNAQEAVVGSALSLPGPSESMVVSPDNVTGYVAVPSASVNGRSQGVVQVLNLNTNTITATLPVPGARFVAVSHNGNRVL